MIETLGIDVGGTKIAAGLVDRNFRVRQVQIVPTSQTDLLRQLEQLIQGYRGFGAIGLGLPGQVLPNGTVVKLGNIKSFKAVNLKKVLERKFKVPVSVINDSKAFALAEARVGSGRNFGLVAGVILGTGIGVGFVTHKKLLWGANALAGELEHVIMPDGKNLRFYVRRGKPFKTAPAAKSILKVLISMIVLSFNPEVIILGGGWSILPGLRKIAEAATLNTGYASKTPVLISKLKYAGIIGATLPLRK